MKKLLFPLLLCAAAIGLAGCDDDMPTSGHLTVSFGSPRIPEAVSIKTAENGTLYETKVQGYKAEFELLPGNYRIVPSGFFGEHWCQVIAGKTTVMSFDSGGNSTSYIK